MQLQLRLGAGGGAGPGPTWAGFGVPSPGVSACEGRPVKLWGVPGAAGGAGSGVMGWAAPLASSKAHSGHSESIFKALQVKSMSAPLLLTQLSCSPQGAELGYQGRGWGCPTPSPAPAGSQPCCGKGLGAPSPFSQLRAGRLWMRCEHGAVAVPCLTPAPLGWNPWLGSVLWVWERLCTDFLRNFQMVELKVPYAILCSPQQRAGAQHRVFGSPGQQLVPVALCCWQESVESLRGEGDEFSL